MTGKVWRQVRTAVAATASIVVAASVICLTAPASAAEAHAVSAAQACEEGNREAAARVGDAFGSETVLSAMGAEGEFSTVVALRWSAAARCAWAWIGGTPQSEVWIDRRPARDQTRVESRLYPRSISRSNSNTYGAAVPLPVGTEVRACGKFRIKPTCTLWFDGEGVSADHGDAPPSYVALGDSFAAGEGAGSYEPTTEVRGNYCHRSRVAYATAVGRSVAMAPTFVACSSATTDDYWSPQSLRAVDDAAVKGAICTRWGSCERFNQPPQRDMINQSTTLVTLTLGGNNAGFGAIAADCAFSKSTPPTEPAADVPAEEYGVWTCLDRIEQGVADVPKLQEPLSSVLSDIKRRAPRAEIFILGYPRMFPKDPPARCERGAFGVDIRKDEMQKMNELVAVLNDRVERSAGTDATYVDVTEAFAGHELCGEGDEWINGFKGAAPAMKQQSYHPTAAGQAAFAARILACRTDRARCL